MKGHIDLMGPAMAITKEGVLVAETKAVQNMKKAILMVAGSAAQKFATKLAFEQEIIMNATDMIIEAFACESILLRTKKLIATKGETEAKSFIEMTKVYINDAIDRVNLHGKNAISSYAEGDELKLMLMGLKRFTKYQPVNTKELRRSIADKLIEANKFCF